MGTRLEARICDLGFWDNAYNNLEINKKEFRRQIKNQGTRLETRG